MHPDKIKSRLRRMKELSLGAIGRKCFGRGLKNLEGIGVRLWNRYEVGEKDLLKELNLECLSEIEEAVNESPCSFFVHPQCRGTIEKSFKQYYPDAMPSILEAADRVLKHRIEILGYGPVNVGRDIAWSSDFISGKRWKNRFAPLIRVGDIYDRADIKVPWELSRFQHLIPLGKAYWLTGNEIYAREAVSQIKDWIEKNPGGFGIHWTCAMEASIRVVNWIWAYAFFRDSNSFGLGFRGQFFRSILSHGKFIRSNLENKQEVINNHYLADLVGLITIGTSFPQFQISTEWREFARSNFFEQIDRQVLDDGVNFELSTGYQRLDLEMAISAVLFSRAVGYEIPVGSWRKIERMFEFVMYYTKPDGSVPQLGDDDDGRLQRMEWGNHLNGIVPPKDHRYLLAVGAVLFNRKDFAWAAGRFWEEAFWLLGNEGLTKFQGLMQRSGRISLRSKRFDNSGIFILRNDDLYMIADCGRNGQGGLGGHNHNDTLGFELFAYGNSFLVDPGTYNYTGDIQWRNKFRSTAFHNVVVVDGKEINNFNSEECFRLKDNAEVKVLQWVSDTEKDILEAQHEGFSSLPGSPLHKRKIYFNKLDNYWLLEDVILGNGKHKCELIFHFSSLDLVSLGSDSENSYLARSKGSMLLIHPLNGERLVSRMTSGWISPCYGVKTQTPVLRYENKSNLPVRFITLLHPVVKMAIELGDYVPGAITWFEKMGRRLN